MTHLREEDFIDLLLGEPHSSKLDRHLATCNGCREQMRVLEHGLGLAREAEPRAPIMVVPKISYRSFKRRSIFSKLTWVAAAAMLLFSLFGLRLEVGSQGFALQFSWLGRSTGNTESRIRDLESNFMKAIELNAALTQSQLDARFNALFEERDQEMGSFSKALHTKMTDLTFQNALFLASAKEELSATARERELRGKLP